MSDNGIANDKEYKKYLKEAKKDDTIVCRPPRRESQTLSLVLPLAPSVNNLYVAVKRKGGRGYNIVMNKDGKSYIQSVKHKVQKQMVQQKYILEPHGVWLVMEITFFFPDRGVRDTHNMHKVLADALEGTAYHNDRWVIIRDMDVQCDPNNPRLEINIRCHKKESYQVLKTN